MVLVMDSAMWMKRWNEWSMYYTRIGSDIIANRVLQFLCFCIARYLFLSAPLVVLYAHVVDTSYKYNISIIPLLLFLIFAKPYTYGYLKMELKLINHNRMFVIICMVHFPITILFQIALWCLLSARTLLPTVWDKIIVIVFVYSIIGGKIGILVIKDESYSGGWVGLFGLKCCARNVSFRISISSTSRSHRKLKFTSKIHFSHFSYILQHYYLPLYYIFWFKFNFMKEDVIMKLIRLHINWMYNRWNS